MGVSPGTFFRIWHRITVQSVSPAKYLRGCSAAMALSWDSDMLNYVTAFVNGIATFLCSHA